jgi:hypothetical protein
MSVSPEVYDAVVTAMRKHGMPMEALPWVLAIVLGESNGDPRATRENDNSSLRAQGIAAQPEASYGIFQLNTMGGRGTGYTKAQLYDPYLNADVNMPALKKTWDSLGGLQAAQADPAGFLSTFYQRGQGSIPQSRERATELLGRVRLAGADTNYQVAPATQQGGTGMQTPQEWAAANPPPDRGSYPQDAYGAEDYNAAYSAWMDNWASYAAVYNTMNPAAGQGKDPNDVATQDFQNRIQEQTLGLAYDNTNLTKAAKDIDRFLSGQEESRARADLALQGQRELIKYGTRDGKTDFSLSDLGSGFSKLGGMMGLNPDDAFLKYSGTTWIDPAADMANPNPYGFAQVGQGIEAFGQWWR